MPATNIKIRNYMSSSDIPEISLWFSVSGAIVGSTAFAFMIGQYATFGEIVMSAIVGAIVGAVIGLVWFISIPLLVFSIMIALIVSSINN